MNPKDECELLLSELLPAAQHLLEKNRELYPIGAVLNNDDTVTFTAVQGEGNSADMIALIEKGHRESSENIKVSGIAYDAKVMLHGRKTDAIMFSLEHHNGYSVTVGLPYTVTLFKRIKYGEIFAQQGTHSVF